MPVLRRLRADRRGAIGIVFGVLAPVLLLTVALALDTVAAARDSLHLQRLADRTAISAAPLWAAGNRAGAIAVARAIVAADGGGVAVEHAGAGGGHWVARPDAFAVTLAAAPRRWLAGVIGTEPPRASAIAVGPRLVE